MIKAILTVILFGLFLDRHGIHRGGSIALTAAHAILVFEALDKGLTAIATVALAQTLFYLATGLWTVLAASALLASIPGVWMAATQAALDMILGRGLEVTLYIEIYTRSLAASLAAMYVLHTLNYSEAAYLAYKLGGCTAAYIPLLIPRMASQGAAELLDSYASHRLKGAKHWETLALFMLRVEEASSLAVDAYTLSSRLCRPRPVYRGAAVALQAAVIAVDLAATL